VGRLNYETTEKGLLKIFEHYGEIKRIKVIRDIKTNKSKGYAFIEYRD
jgi:U1 small nuclear ribonucleoprotein